jgi:ornithine carbamoyltransferase
MNSLQGRDLLTLADLAPEELKRILAEASLLKRKIKRPNLQGKVLGLLFQKASTRTRVSFSAAIAQCGGTVVDLMPTVLQVSRGEPIQDTARVLSRYLDVIAIRTFEQKELEHFADYASVPVINALTNQFHPCQILADLLTIQESWGRLQGIQVAYCGDGNNIVHSLLLGCAMTGVSLRVATPEGFAPDPQIVQKAEALAQTFASLSQIEILTDPVVAVTGAQVVYTDVWASMGQEEEATTRLPLFQPYQVNDELMKLADPNAIVLHCLPAHRGEEITDSVLESSQSRVWEQAENRLHVQKSLLVQVLGQ